MASPVEWFYEHADGYTGTVKTQEGWEAAEEAWEILCRRNPEYYKGGEITVWTREGPRRTFVVEVETRPVFHATIKP